MDKEEFLSSYGIILESINDLLHITKQYEDIQQCSAAFALESIKRQNPNMVSGAHEQITAYDSMVNADVTRRLALRHPDSGLVSCERNLRAKVQALFIEELNRIAEVCIAENEPEPRKLFVMVICRLTSRYETEINSGGYMMFNAEWFKEQVVELDKMLSGSVDELRCRYLELGNLTTLTHALLSDSVNVGDQPSTKTKFEEIFAIALRQMAERRRPDEFK